jgi:hypothetical protein
MLNLTGVVDEPVRPGGPDKLGIQVHTKSLTKFIDRTNTPITIGVQGEWGSGKTSLIHSIYHHFDSRPIKKELQIWVNSWEYSLLCNPEEALLKIVNKILADLLEADGNIGRGEKIKAGASQIFKGALRVGASVALGNAASQVAEELLQSSGQSIAALRKQLSDLVNDIAIRDSNSFDKVIIYVDDLDRIEPRHAVSILELLKNIFSVPHCVFVLAIDYQVVVKGLEYKFGKQTPENEWEFRAFFDKIIQLPFMMPMGQYDIGQYVSALLVDIGFVDAGKLDQDAVRDIILWTIGGNPRSIKRLVNSVSLIQIFTETKSEEDIDNANGGDSRIEHEQFLLFSLLCLQIAYPQIYSLLNKESDFSSWDESFAFQITDKIEEKDGELFDRDFQVAQQSEDCDEEWERALFRMCYSRPRLRPRFRDVSRFLSYIKDEIFSQDEKSIGKALSEILSQTSVTNVTTTDGGQEGPKKGKRNLFDDTEWTRRLSAKLNEADLAKVSEVLSMLKASSKYLKVHFSHADGASFYHPETKKVCFRMTVKGKSSNKKLYISGFLRDFKHNFNVPKVDGFEIDTRKPTPTQRYRWDGAFALACSFDSLDENRLRSLNVLAQRSFELYGDRYFDERSKLIEIGNKIAASDSEAIEWCENLFSLEPYEHEVS